MEEDERYQEGFNAGYLLQQYEPDIANILDTIHSEDSYWQALKAGREQYLLEMKERVKAHTKNHPEPSKDKDKGMERER